MAKAKAAKRKYECKTSDEPTEAELIAEDMLVKEIDVAEEAVSVEVDENIARSREMLRRRFGPYLPPTDETKPKFKQIQEAALIFAEMIYDVCPDCQQRSAAFTLLEQAKMLANAAIAIHCTPTTAKKRVQV
jgi:NMD protein affecting ribosome stability and mRNA decay